MKINNNRAHIYILAALSLGMTVCPLMAVEDGQGTNVVRNLRVVNGGAMDLGGTAITNWLTMPVGTGAVSLVDYMAWSNTVYDATNILNTRVNTDLAGATSALYTATGSLNTAVATLTGRTNAWDNGVVIKAGTGALVAGNLYYMNGSSAWAPANATTNTTAQGLIGLALETDAAEPYNVGLLLNGQYDTGGAHGLTVGAPIYLSTTDYLMTSTPPSGTNNIVRILGYAISATKIMFNPDRTYVEILGE